jgi:hypothetical protein
MQCYAASVLNQRAVLSSTKGEATTRSQLRPSYPTHRPFPHDCVLQLGQFFHFMTSYRTLFFHSIPLFSSSYKGISVHILLGCTSGGNSGGHNISHSHSRSYSYHHNNGKPTRDRGDPVGDLRCSLAQVSFRRERQIGKGSRARRESWPGILMVEREAKYNYEYNELGDYALLCT